MILPSRISSPDWTRTISWKNFSPTSLRSKPFHNPPSPMKLREILRGSHRRVREMEHELSQSRFKPLVEGGLLSDIIESSSTGEHPHRAVVMELILERSIQRRCKGVLPKVKDNPQPDSISPSKGSSEVPNTPVQQVLPSSPSAAQQLQPQSSSNFFLTSALTVNDPLPGPSTLSEPPRKTKEATHDQPPANTKANPSQEHTVELVCSRCGSKPRLTWAVFRCTSCPGKTCDIMKCSCCGTTRVAGTHDCSNCYGKFKY